MHPLLQYELVKARQADLLRQAEQRRLVNIASAARPSVTARILERIGALLISVGSYFKERAVREQSRKFTPVQKSSI